MKKEVHKHLYRNIIEYQKYKGTSIKLGCPTSCAGGQILRLNESRLTIRGDRAQNRNIHLYGPILLVSQSATLKESVQGCRRAKHKANSPLDDHWVIVTALKAFQYFQIRRDEICFAFDPP